MGEAGSARRIRDCSFRPARCRGGETHRRRPGHGSVPASRARRVGPAQLRLGLERTSRSGVRITCTVNGLPRVAEDVWEGESLLSVLREHLDLPGSKNACEQGECGSCTPGLVVATHDLLTRVSQPTTTEIREALAGNICRCTGYAKIIDAVHLAATRQPK